MFLYILLVAVSSHVALLAFITENDLKLLEELSHYNHYLFSVYQLLDGRHLRPH